MHPQMPLNRVLNLIVYLNHDWDPAWGGNLELWERDSGPVVDIEPLFNRALLFVTTADALHGHPTRLECPPDRSRMSMSVYYWTATVSRNEPRNARVIWFGGGGSTAGGGFLERLRQSVPPGLRRRLRRRR